jgi:DNA-binding response OmpR family regulator
MAKKRALIVEDNAETRSALQEAFTFWGYDADVAEDALQALAVAESGRPDVIVMDSGPRALDVIGRVKAEDANVFVVVFSGWAHLEAPARAAGADAFVLKPDIAGLERVLAGRAS